MSTRCKACDEEFITISYNKKHGEFEDMCAKCRTLGRQGFIYSYDHRHTLQDARDGEATEPWDNSHI